MRITNDRPLPHPVVADDFEPDQFGVVRWRAGILDELKRSLGLEPLVVREPLNGLPFVVNLTRGSAVQPVFDFLARRAVLKGFGGIHTLDAYAYDLRSWFEFLALVQTAWNRADQNCFDEWVLDMASAEAIGGIDPDEPEEFGVKPLATATIRRRSSAVASFYQHATGGIPFDRGLVASVGTAPEESVRPIPPEDLKAFFAALGPAPSQWCGVGSSRLWLCCLVALATGMRRMEVCGLDVEHFEGFPSPCDPLQEFRIRIEVTKGGRPRAVSVYGWLINAVVRYIRGERAEAATKLAMAPAALFLNHADARRCAGERLLPATLSHDLRRVMLRAEITRKNPSFRYGAGSSHRPHTFHDLRHTCACLLYESFAGVSEPWIEVQNRLGHRLLETTIRVYLRHLGEVSRRSGDLRQPIIDGLIAA